MTRLTRFSAQRAVAIPSVLLAMSLASAVAVGAAYVSRQQASTARFSQRGLELVHHAERGLVEAVARWDSVGRAAQPVGFTHRLAPASDSGVVTQVWITRTSTTQYWLVAASTSDWRPALRRRIGLLVSVASGRPRPVKQRAWADLP